INIESLDNIDIPKDWKIKKLHSLTKKIGSGITPNGGEKVYKKEGHPFLRSQNIGWGILLTDNVVFIDDEIHNSFKSTEIQTDDVFLNITGASIGRSAVANVFVKGGNVNQHVCIIRTKKEELSPYFLNSFLLSRKGQNLIESYQAGGNRQGLNFEQIKSFKIPLPSLPEQKAIAQLLSTWDDVITKTQSLIAKKEQRKKWLMQNLLTGKKRLKGFGGEWKEVKLNDISEIDKLSLSNQTPDDYSFQYLSLSDVDAGATEIKSEKLSFKGSPSRARRIVRKGDVLLATVRPNLQGFLIIRDDVKDLIASTGFAVISCTKINNEFLYQFLFTKNLMNQIESFLTGSNYPAINSSDVRDLKVPLPSMEEQNVISEVLQKADTEIQLLKNKMGKLKEQKKGLMQVLLTGKKRLKIK
ncbi:MAG: restriction endonuclease subunit S, partial [Ginsengibacter sp.]